MKSSAKILTIEAIRGFAAIYVMLGHIVLLYKPYSYFPGYEFPIKTLFGYGHQAVILFFIVSGFSIHYSSSTVNFYQKGSLKEYLFKRGRRIYPLFIISLILAFSVLFITRTHSDWIRNTLSFFFLTDISAGSFADPIPTNFPIWSLSYEVVYYLIYPLLLISIRKTGIQTVYYISLIISLCSALFGNLVLHNHFSNVFQLYWTWVIGAVIAEMKMHDHKVSISYLRGFLVLSIAFMFTLEKLDVLRDWSWALFFSLLIFSFFSKADKINIYQKLASFFIGLTGIVICYFLTFYESVAFHPQLLRNILVLFAFSFVFINFIPFHYIQAALRFVLRPFVWAGGFSYALYIFHWPLIMLFQYIFRDFIQLNFGILFIIIAINLFIVFLLSWFSELHLQPIMAKFLTKIYYQGTSKNKVV